MTECLSFLYILTKWKFCLNCSFKCSWKTAISNLWRKLLLNLHVPKETPTLNKSGPRALTTRSQLWWPLAFEQKQTVREFGIAVGLAADWSFSRQPNCRIWPAFLHYGAQPYPSEQTPSLSKNSSTSTYIPRSLLTTPLCSSVIWHTR